MGQIMRVLVASHKINDYPEIKAACHTAAPGPQRKRSRTYQSIANAMAAQWGTV